MRSLFRTLASATMLTALVFGAAASTVAAGSTLASAVSSAGYELTEEWCVEQGPVRDCTVVNATLIVTSAPDGRETVRVTLRETMSSEAPDGSPVGAPRTSSFSRTMFTDGSRDPSFSVSLAHAVDDGGACVWTYIVTVVEYELFVERLAAPDC